MRLGQEEASARAFGAVNRRRFLEWTSASSLALLSANWRVMAGPFEASDLARLVPEDKKLDPAWVRSLFERGTPARHRGPALKWIGMPVGGLCAGQLYLGGDGKLWHWDIFNLPQNSGSAGSHYAKPLEPRSLIEQGFAVRTSVRGKVQTRRLDQSGFTEVRFLGQYPIGEVEYRDPESPVEVQLKAFSPFAPLAPEDSSLPATVLRFEVKNVSGAALDASLGGWIENGVCLDHRSGDGVRRNHVIRGNGLTFLNCSVEKSAAPGPPRREDILFENWDEAGYRDWTVEGRAFGSGPVKRTEIPSYQGDVGGPGERVVNSHATAPGNTVAEKDSAVGKLTSKKFTVERNYINFWIGGGAHQGKTALNLVVDGRVARTATGRNSNRMSEQSFDVRSMQGKDAVLEITDAESGPWGNIGIGRITFSDRPLAQGPMEELPDYGTMGLGILGKTAELWTARSEPGGLGEAMTEEATAPLEEKLIGSVGRTVHLRPGESAPIDFVVAWHFPNLKLEGLGSVGRFYATRFSSAHAVAEHVSANFERLSSMTELWRQTWYDSTLPYWLLDRTFLNASILATSTAHRFANGRFYSWEGVGCCAGTCTHVWHYAHAVARLFPSLERDTRERVDLGIAFNSSTGVMGFRAEFDRNLAVDGQAGTLLRMYREHQMSGDGSFLRRNWERIRKAFEPLLALDGNDDGVLEGAQMNTLDTAWHGKIAWLSSLYLAALRAGEQMARETNDLNFAARCRAVADRGEKNIVSELFNGEYFQNRADPKHPEAINSGSGCEIDQVFGQSWAFQVNLDRILPQPETASALRSLWKYNFTPDVGLYRKAHKPGRWYAMPGEAGLLMCTFPRADWDYEKASGKGPDWAAGYFNECMNGFEYEVAGHMVHEGLVMEGLAVTRAIHDRYDPLRRNPWNEIECGDHYARSMASYGVFLAVCGFQYHGPRRHIAFAPRITPENFRCAFTAAEGWGTFQQKIAGKELIASIELKSGSLGVRTLGLGVPEKAGAGNVNVVVNGNGVGAAGTRKEDRFLVTLNEDAALKTGEKLVVIVSLV